MIKIEARMGHASGAFPDEKMLLLSDDGGFEYIGVFEPRLYRTGEPREALTAEAVWEKVKRWQDKEAA